jgi:hypothetical protein
MAACLAMVSGILATIDFLVDLLRAAIGASLAESLASRHRRRLTT